MKQILLWSRHKYKYKLISKPALHAMNEEKFPFLSITIAATLVPIEAPQLEL